MAGPQTADKVLASGGDFFYNVGMLREQNVKQIMMEFVSIEELVPQDHLLRKIDKVIDFGFIRERVKDLYCADNGRPGIDPEVAVRLMLAGFLLCIVHDRRLVREAHPR